MARNKKKNGVKDKEGMKKVRKEAKKRWRARKAKAFEKTLKEAGKLKTVEEKPVEEMQVEEIQVEENPVEEKRVGREEAFPRLHGSVKEIAHTEVVKLGRSIGAGTFGSCYLGKYRGILVAVKEFRQLPGANPQTIKDDVLYEAAVISRLGDNPGLPLLFGVSSVQMPYRLITQFHGHQDESLTIHKAIQKRLLGSAMWIEVMSNVSKALSQVHTMGFLHNDLKSNNVVLEKRERAYNPVIIDFGKARKRDRPKPLKKPLTAEQRKAYSKKYPHIAPEIVRGQKKQSIESDIFSLGYMFTLIHPLLSTGHQQELALLVKGTVSEIPAKRPSLDKIQIKCLRTLSVHH